MDFLYSLYDALVSINVPNDMARAVVDAMERDMGTTLATKADLRALATREDVTQLREGLALLRKDMEIQSATLTVRLGSMLVVGLGVLFAALKVA
jgi:IS4 transposase